MEDRTQELAEKPIGRLLWVYALPAVISQIVAAVYNLCDRIFIGQGVGDLAIAGLAITMPVMNIVHAFGALVGAGSAARISIVLGRKDYRWAEKILGNSMLLTFFFGALFVPAVYLFMDPILNAFGASADTISYAREYMVIVMPGMFLTTLTFNLTGLIRATGYPTKAMLILSGGAVLNIILDPIFIFLLDWGIVGAAWATTISMAVSSVFSVAHFVSKKSFIRFKSHCWQPKLYIFRNITMIGISPFLMNICGAGVIAILNKQLINYGGDLAVGAVGIVNSVSNIMLLMFLGICQGMQPIAGYNYGAGLQHRLKDIYILTVKVCCTVGLVATILGVFFPQYVLQLFGPSDEMLQIGIVVSHFLMLLFPVIGYTITNSQFFMAIDKPWISIVTSLSRQLIFLLPMAILVPRLFINIDFINLFHVTPDAAFQNPNGLYGVYAACTTSDLLGGVLAFVLMLTQRKVFRPGYMAPERRPRKEAGPKESDTRDA